MWVFWPIREKENEMTKNENLSSFPSLINLRLKMKVFFFLSNYEFDPYIILIIKI